MIEALIAPVNPIVFVLDPSNDSIDVPEYVSGVVAASTGSCISIGIQADVDGETNIKLATEIPEDDRSRMHKGFEGQIATPGKQVAVVTAEFEGVVEQPVTADHSTVEVWVDDPDYPGEVLVLTA